MSASSQNAIIGCLLDVSGSMREALEAGHSEERTTERLYVVLRTALQVARIEANRNPDALMFVGVFGLNQNHGCPPVVDLCRTITALLDISGDKLSGHDRLIELAKENDRVHISKYIRSKLTDDQARIVYRHLLRHTKDIKKFVEAIPTNKEADRAKRNAISGTSLSFAIAGGFLLGPLGLLIGAATGGGAGYAGTHLVERSKVDNSEAMEFAKEIWNKWWQGLTLFKPLPIAKVIDLLQQLQEHSMSLGSKRIGDRSTEMQVPSGQIASAQCSEEQDAEKQNDKSMLDWLRPYIYGSTPLTQALTKALEVFPEPDEHNVFQQRPPRRTKQPNPIRVLLVISDGFSTDGDPQEPVHTLVKKKKITLAAVYLTDDPEIPQRRLYDSTIKGWDKGQHTLFSICSKIAGNTHPVPVLASMGWELPSSGEFALYACVYTAEALEEFCSALISARFGSADILLDLVGRVNLDRYINDTHMCTLKTPSDQGQERTCYAHAAAAVIHMALSRIWGLEGGYPAIEKIRERIIANFPQARGGRFMEEVLEKATGPTWYPPLKFCEVKEEGARQAVLRRQPVLTTFCLSAAGWESFSLHFETKATAKSILTLHDMKKHRSGPPAGAHAVILTGCGPGSLTFLNSWGKYWGDGGSFSVENISVLELDRYPARFYKVYWLEDDLTEVEQKAYERYVDNEIRSHASRYPSFFEFEARCPICKESARVADFTGSIRRAVCPGCRKSFAPEPGHLVQALYMQAGLSDAP